MNMNEECLLKYLQNPQELFDLNVMLSEIDSDYSDILSDAVMPDYMVQHIF